MCRLQHIRWPSRRPAMENVATHKMPLYILDPTSAADAATGANF
jgi:hypothetical protein